MALAASLGHSPSPSALVSSSSPSPPPSSSSHLAPHFVFPTPSATLPSSQPPASSLPIVSMVPPMSRRPTITTQMNPAWMREYEDRTKTVAIKKGTPRIDPVISRRFQIAYWDRDGEPATIHSIHGCATWPIWCLSEAPEVLAALGSNITMLDQYEVKSSYWRQVDLNYPHLLTTECHLFLRQRKVTCLDLDKWLARLLPSRLDFWLGMKAQRDRV